MRPLLNASNLRLWDQFTIDEQNITAFGLMERAAKSFCVAYMEKFQNKHQITCIIAGPGNNGGDGLAIARILHQNGYKHLYIFESQEVKSIDQNERNRNQALLKKIGTVQWIDSKEALYSFYQENIVFTIDAVFGTGLSRAVNEEWKTTFKMVNQYSSKIISVDLPSGLQSDQESLNPEETSIIAHHTFTFQTYKRTMTFPETGALCGKIHVLDIGLSKNFAPDSMGNIFLIDHSIWNSLEENRTFDHKGSNGKTLHYCGSIKMPGAGILCSKAAHRSGAGYVIAVVPDKNVSILIAQHPEVLPITYTESEGLNLNQHLLEIQGLSSVLAGPGLGSSEFVRMNIQRILSLELSIPLILDADALNILNGKPEILSIWKGPLVITPHVKEFDSLFGRSENWFQREHKMRQMSATLKICIILKGAFTRIAFPDGTLYINTSGNPGLAKAGSGDVLSGILSAHLARYKDFKNAVISAVYLHGKVADDLSEAISEKSIMATDLIKQLGKTIKSLESDE